MAELASARRMRPRHSGAGGSDAAAFSAAGAFAAGPNAQPSGDEYYSPPIVIHSHGRSGSTLLLEVLEHLVYLREPLMLFWDTRSSCEAWTCQRRRRRRKRSGNNNHMKRRNFSARWAAVRSQGGQGYRLQPALLVLR